MKNILIITTALLSLNSCKSKKGLDPETLPKDILLKQDHNLPQMEDREKLASLIKEIEMLANSEVCTDASVWKFAEIGSKPCGGPSSYLAYPAKLEGEVLPKIKNFTQMQSAFNKKYSLSSDCALVQPPSGIKCVDGKAVLTGGSSAVSEAQ